MDREKQRAEEDELEQYKEERWMELQADMASTLDAIRDEILEEEGCGCMALKHSDGIVFALCLDHCVSFPKIPETMPLIG